MAEYRLLCSGNPDHQDELLKMSGRNTGDFFTAEGMSCPKCGATVAFVTVRDNDRLAWIRESFQLMME